MHFHFNIRAIVLLFILSICGLVLHRMGGLVITKSLLADGEHVNIGSIFSEGVKGDYQLVNGIPSSTCTLTNIEGYNVCGLTIRLTDNPEKGVNLSSYNRVELDVRYHSPLKNSKIRFSLRNFNQQYSTANDPVSLKFNSINFEPEQNYAVISVPLNAFQVENWWVEQFTVGFENAQLDFSNIAFIDIVPNSMPVLGEYHIEVHRVVLVGELISEQDLLKIILLVWLVAIILLISLQRNKLKAVSITDALTGLLNRRGLNQWVSSRLKSFALRAPLTMFYFDLDDFKKINDSYGHIVGDELLCGFCRRMNETLLAQDYLTQKYVFSRLSGDEFAIVFIGISEEKQVRLAESLIGALDEPIALSAGNIKVSSSLGIATSDKDTNTFETLMSKADSAMYHIKKKGKNQFKIFDDSVSREILFRKQVAEKIRRALKFNKFFLHFMPIYHANDLSVYGAEILLRCNSDELVNIGPDVLIPIAEEFGIIKEIDLWVIEATFKNLAENQQQLSNPSLVFGINISAVELHNKQFTKDLKNLLDKYKINPTSIEIEITETSLVETDELSISILKEIRSLGISLALDDFGTGYTAFNQLIHYPVDCLKIDKSFVDDLMSSSDSRKTMIKAMLSIAKAYNLKTVAEGVETFSQYQYLAERGCDMMQGYLLSKPIEWDALVRLCNEPSANRLAMLAEQAE